MFRLFIILTAIFLTTTLSAQEWELPFKISPVATFNEPWAMTFLPDGRMLVTEKRGNLYIVTQDSYYSVTPNWRALYDIWELSW